MDGVAPGVAGLRKLPGADRGVAFGDDKVSLVRLRDNILSGISNPDLFLIYNFLLKNRVR